MEKEARPFKIAPTYTQSKIESKVADFCLKYANLTPDFLG